MPSNFTANYNLSQWERTDKVQMEDFNEDNAKIDGAIKAQADGLAAEADARTALAAQVAKRGNCKIYVAACGSYGFIPLPGKPELLFLVDENVHFILASPRLSKAMHYSPGAVTSGSVAVTWSDSGITVGTGISSPTTFTSFVVAFYAL